MSSWTYNILDFSYVKHVHIMLIKGSEVPVQGYFMRFLNKRNYKN